MNRIFQYGVIGLSLVVGFLANGYLGGEDSQGIAPQQAETQGPVIVDAGQSSQQQSYRAEVTKVKQSNSFVDNTAVESVGRTSDDSQQQDVDWQQQKAQVEAELLALTRDFTKLHQKHLNAKARLDSLRYNATDKDIESRLVGTSFELLQSKLSAREWEQYKAFDDLADTHPSSYELQTILNDYFILHVNGDVMRLHNTDCKSNVCILYVYSNDFVKSLATFTAIDQITDEYKLRVNAYKSFYIEEGEYSNENYKAALMVVLSAKKNQ